ncbi:YjiH family protein [Acidaminobacter hydrogenoformans]|uniref:Nucleoside recognition GATE domain-containing membrane protein YjiH n=1 Tax=Acidaminobacter hydrogenoformans DSM 2784 TaxID=1120920 RepID=A0A1G5RQ29_9FIRM|nr:nucleoside recognition domain-containing protein [Acidaminobacter hydrogenoformans]SCZ76114.1 nucleoside recognition GATE domain-containing membrane protein YjiH [Acidaminobacter hydrogenoformans DSM 2784]
MENNNVNSIEVGKVTYDSDMQSTDLDSIQLSSNEYLTGLLKMVILSAIGIFVFFFSVPVNGESKIVFAVIYNAFINMFGNFAYWILLTLIGGNLIVHLKYKYFDKSPKVSLLAKIYENDTVVHSVLYAIGTLYALLYAMKVNVPGFEGVEIITGAATGGSVFPPIVLGVLGIITVGAVFMPLLLNYGVLEIIGVLLEPLMRPLFKVPGKAALDATASFVSSSSLGVLITNRLWKMNVYTEKEMVTIMTGFSAVSIGFAYLVIETAGLADQFIKVYGISFILVFLIAPIMVRIPPVSRKKDIFFNGHEQTVEERMEETSYNSKTLSRGFNRAVKRAYIAKSLGYNLKESLKDSILIIPQVLTMLSAVGVSALILAEYTPVFNWVGYVFEPIVRVLQIPDAAIIAASIPIGIAEMFLPVLLIQNHIEVLSIEARAFVTIVSMVQIIFFSETATVMLATKSPIKVREIVICFIERTLIAMPLAAIAIHIFF